MKTALGKRAKGERLERMKASPLWAEQGFHNVHPVLPGLRVGSPSIRAFLCGPEHRKPPAPLPSHDPRAVWTQPPETGLRATWLGHSTVLVEIDGARVLTDPVWGERASPTSFAGPKRFQPVPVSVANLPAVDVVVISHDHYDHLDYPTILELAHYDVPFVTSLGVGAHLESWGIPAARITELDWWQSHEVAGLTITATPSQHFSGRSVGDRNSTLWSSMTVKGPRHSFFFSGDTGLTTEYGAIREKFGPFDLVMLEVGAFDPSWGDIHLGPAHALEAYGLIGGGSFLPVHWGTFNLALHAWDQPAETLVELAPKQGAHLLMPHLGEPVEPSRAGDVVPWWREIARLETKDAKPLDETEAVTATTEEGVQWPID